MRVPFERFFSRKVFSILRSSGRQSLYLSVLRSDDHLNSFDAILQNSRLLRYEPVLILG